ncbi:MAG: TAXI family TRAP transporter solute-binding subunit [Paracoccaceae bacterium]
MRGRTGWLVVAAMLGGLAAGAAAAQDIKKTIVTGGPSGTYIQIGRDISEAVASCGLTLDVRESAGSLENFLAVRQRPHTQFGIVQSDVLEYFKTFEGDDPAIRRALYGVQIAFPLYDEEVHVLARRGIETLSDLAGRRVAIGETDSGTFLTASLILEFAGVAPETVETIGPDASLDALLAGDIDAFFYVAGAPARLFEDERIDPERFALLSMADDTLRAVYTPATVPAGTYGWMTEDVSVVAVKAVLMTFDYDPGRNAYHRESCRAVSEVSHVVVDQFERLKAEGHPKWREVDLTDIPPGWRIGECVNRGLDPDFQSACAPAAPAVETEPRVNAVYRERICAVVGC